MRISGFLSAILLYLLSAGAAAAQEPTPEGVWLHRNERIHVEIAPCDSAHCGRIVWLLNPDDEAEVPLADARNPDRTLRGRAVMGMTVMSGLVRTGPRLWSGTIYNPDDGKTYSARVTVVNPDTLHVRAFLLLPLFGQTQIWTRVKR